VHKAVAGRLETGGASSVTGQVTFNHTPLTDLKPRRLACFVGQTDQHFPDLTVLETCKFAQDCNRLFDPEDHGPLQELHQMVGFSQGYPLLSLLLRSPGYARLSECEGVRTLTPLSFKWGKSSTFGT